MKKDHVGWTIVILSFMALIYLVELSQRFIKATPVKHPVLEEINANFKEFGFDYQIQAFTYDNLFIHIPSVEYNYDKVYFPKAQLGKMSREEVARFLLDITPCQFTSIALAKPGTKETKDDPKLFNNVKRPKLSHQEINKIWNNGFVEIKSSGRGMAMTKRVSVDQANNNVFNYFDPKRYETSLKNNLRQVMIESFSDKALIKLKNLKCNN